MSTNFLHTIDSALNHKRISPDEAFTLWKDGDIHTLGKAANTLRNRAVQAGKVSYTVFRIINYTDVCTIGCKFCSFQHVPGDTNGTTLTLDQILQKVQDSYNQDCRQVFFQGGVNPDLNLRYYTDALEAIHKQFPDVHIRGFSPVEILHMSGNFKMPVKEVFSALIDAGLQSFPGAGAEILTERMRNILSDNKATPDQWFDIMKTALTMGLKGSTNIVWGASETDREIIEHLTLIRRLQDETGNVLSFVPWTFQKQTKNFSVRYVSATEYLKMVSLSRIFLDNIPNIEVSLLVKGTVLGEVALSFGANDINSPVIEENVLRSFGLGSIQEAEEFIRNAGYEPVRRNFNYETGKKS